MLRPSLLAALALSACGPSPAPPPVSEAGAVAVPADSGALAPRLALDASGRPLLSWVEPDGDGHALRYAAWTGAGWGDPATADAGPGWFVNWADTPGVTPLSGGTLLAHTLTAHPEADAPYHYDVSVRAAEAGRWGPRRLLHDDGVLAEHGFVSAVPLGDGRAGVVWLDGRDTGGHEGGGGAMTLRYATVGADGALTDEARLDARTCDCCATAVAAVPGGLVVAYRDRSEAEVRDIAVVRLVGGAWTEPSVPHPDGWRIEGCPVNGPALASDGARVALAWYTEAKNTPRVRLTVSEDGGATFGRAVGVDGGAPMGRVGVALRADGTAVVSWMERAGDRAEIRLRSVAPDGHLGAPTSVATAEAGRTSGMPVMALLGDRALVAWTGPTSVETALVTPAAVGE